MTSDPDKQKHAQAPQTETNRLTSLATAGELFNDTQIHRYESMDNKICAK
jgi:hypothetical protein